MGINNLVIVESPAKAKTIGKFLGKDFEVMSSFGHIRDLTKKNLGIDVNNRFQPEYIVPDEKKKVVTDLKKQVKDAQVVWLASDEDREGEAIAWHLSEVLDLDPKSTKRIVFHEITKDAIQSAISNPRQINVDLVNAQQARRILDRLVGFELSPLLWKKVKPSLSAGRVQSVAVRLLVEREREIMAFKSKGTYRVSAVFEFEDKNKKRYALKAVLQDKLETKKEAIDFLNHCKSAAFKVIDKSTRPSKKSPAAPFTTSTLQQEASRKLGFSVSQTMTIAQHLYEDGKITYMRTDSVNLSQTALEQSKEVILTEFGEKYLNSKNFKTKTKGAQEAHEAIRPAYLDKQTIVGNRNEQRLYELIWKRTIASQMSDALIEKTVINIEVSGSEKQFVASGEVLKFDGFLKLYLESTDDDNEENESGLLPPVEINQPLKYDSISAIEKYSHYPARYTEASLVKKLEELGIGRPSTYAPTISTIQQRGYVIKEDRPGTERKYFELTLKGGNLKEAVQTEIYGAEKAKLFPNNIGMVVNDFLVEHFKDVLDYNFTASVEKEFDDIAEGKLKWADMIERFYKSFHQKVEDTNKTSEKNTGERLLGHHKETGEPIFVKIGRYGPVAQIGESLTDKKPRFASLRKGQLMESISLDEALELFKLPRTVGQLEGQEVVVSIGKFGPYARYNSVFYALKKGIDDPYTVTLDRVIELIKEKTELDKNKTIKTFKEDKDLFVLNGRWGPYIKHKKENYKIPKDKTPANLTYSECLEIIKTSSDKKSGSKK